MRKYFVCHRYRSSIDDKYVRDFYKNKQYSKLHDTYEAAYKEMRAGFYDDSDYSVYEVKDGNFTFERK